MTTLPDAVDFTGASVTEGQFKTAMTSMRDYLSQLLGDDSALREGDDLVINGAMNVDQEAGSFTGVGAAATKYVLDQWLVYTIGSPQGRATVTRESGVFAGFGYSVKIDTTTAEAAVGAGEVWAFQQRFEAQDLQHLKYGSASALSLVCTFNIKSPKSGTHCIALFQPDATRSFVKEFTVASANTEEEITVVFTGDASGTINNDTGEGLRLTWPLVAGSNFQVAANAWAAGEDYATSNQQNLLDNTANNFEITGVRLRLGTVATATPFQHRSFGEELLLAQRYFFKTFEQGTAPASNASREGAMLAVAGHASFGASRQLPVTMRVEGTIITYNPAAAGADWRDVSATADVAVINDLENGDSVVSLRSTGGTEGNKNIIQFTVDSRL